MRPGFNLGAEFFAHYRIKCGGTRATEMRKYHVNKMYFDGPLITRVRASTFARWSRVASLGEIHSRI
jgi:hypothetical protein